MSHPIGSSDAPERTRSTVVVTDSTAQLTGEELNEFDIRVVPLEVVISGEVGTDGVDVAPEQVAAALEQHEPVTTSRPAPARFLAAYEQARDNGAEHVVSVHLSGALSGTVDAARVAAQEASLPVTVIDSRQIGLGLGFAVLTAARRALDGAPVDEVAAAATDVAGASSMLFYVDSLEYLRRGGRIGAASALLGGVLAVKPLLEIGDGEIRPVEKVRTSTRALKRLVELAAKRAGDRPVRLAVHHLAARDRAEQVGQALSERLPGATDPAVRELGAVIGAHAGPGVIAVVIAPT